MNETCPRCNSLIDSKDTFCTHCGYRLDQKRRIQRQPSHPREPNNESSLFLWALIGFLSPIAGIILYLIFKDTKPRSASYSIRGAFVAIVIYVIVVMFFLTLVILQPGAPQTPYI